MKQIFYAVIAMFAAIVAVGCEKERQTIIPPGSTMQYEPTKFETKKVDGVWKIKTIGYKRMYEYYDMISQTQSATLKKTTFLDELNNK